MTKTEEDDLITQSEAARARGVTRSAIAYLIAQGRLQIHERFGLRLVSRREVLAYEPQKPGPKAQTNGAATSKKKGGKK